MRMFVGYYIYTFPNGDKYIVETRESDDYSGTVWVWHKSGRDADDTYSTKREALAAMRDFILNGNR